MTSSFINDAIINTHINNASLCNLSIGIKISGKGLNDTSNANNNYSNFGVGLQLLANSNNNRQLAFIDTSNQNKIIFGITDTNINITSTASNNSIIPLFINSNFVITSSNIGIGTTNPQCNLHVVGNVGIYGSLNLNNRPLVGVSDLQTSNFTSSGTVYANNITISGNLSNLATGIFKSSQWSNQVAVGKEGNIYYIQGDVGIGTATPNSKLHVIGDIRLDNNDIRGINRIFSNDGTVFVSSQWTTSTGNNISYNSGLVGIGTNNPLSLLHLHSNLNSNVGILFTDSNTGSNGIIIMKDSNQNLIIRNLSAASTGGNIIMGVSNTPNALMISSNNGFIGIGTTNPTDALHVIGNSRIIGDVTLSGSLKKADGSLYASSQWSNSSITPTTIFYNAGGVGIGTTSLFIPTGAQNIDLSVRGAITCDRIYINGFELTCNLASGSGTSADNIKAGTVAVTFGGTGTSSLATGQLMIGGATAVTQTSNLAWAPATNSLLVTGNIGIGTSNPQSALHLNSQTPGVVGIRLSDGSTQGVAIQKDATNTLVLSSDVPSGRFSFRNSAGTDTVVITSNGNVGIGSTNPSSALSVGGNVSISGALSAQSLTVAGGTIASTWLQTSDNRIYYNQGYVGIGTSNPQSALHLNRNDNGDIRLQFTDINTGVSSSNGVIVGKDAASNAYLINQSTIGGIRLGTAGLDIITINSNGLVGIGTTNPQSNLHVVGNVGIYGSLNLNNRPLVGVSDLQTSNFTSSGTVYANNITISGNLSNLATGIFKSSQWSNQVAVGKEGNIYYIQGDVGIGTATPNSKLHVIGDIRLDNNDIRGINRIFSNDGTVFVSSQWTTSTGNNISYNSGLVGIGTNNPLSLLHLHSNLNSNVGILFTDSNTGSNGIIIMKDSNQNLIIRNLSAASTGGNIIMGVSNTPNALMISSNNGFIGIGTTNPTDALHVIGNSRIIGDVTLSGSLKKADGSLYASSQWSNSSITPTTIFYNAGGVGIGTTSLFIPTGAQNIDLSVRGAITCDRIYINGFELTCNLASGSGTSADNIKAGTVAVTFGGTGTSSLATGQLMIGGATAVTQTSNLAWAPATNSLLVTGNIGIGTSNPQSALHLNSQTPGVVGIRLSDGSTQGVAIQKDATNTLVLSSDVPSGRFSFRNSAGTDTVVITSNGNVGIGSTNPSSALSVGGNVSISGALSAQSLTVAGGTIASTWLQTSDNRIYYNQGYVGIGTSNPQSALHLNSQTPGVVGIRLSDGSTPGVAIQKDATNTLVLSSDVPSGRFSFRNSAGTDTVVITSNGNVGIGSTNPSSALSVGGNVSISGALSAQSLTVAGGTIASTWLRTSDNRIYYNQGYVGIGTSNPQSALHLNRNDNGDIRLQFTDINTGVSSSNGVIVGKDATSNAYLINQSTIGGIRLGTAGLDRMIITSNGNIGINISPSDTTYKLIINGDMNIIGNLYKDGTSFSSDSSVWGFYKKYHKINIYKNNTTLSLTADNFLIVNNTNIYNNIINANYQITFNDGNISMNGATIDKSYPIIYNENNYYNWHKFDVDTVHGQQIVDANNTISYLYGSNISYNSSIFVRGTKSIYIDKDSSAYLVKLQYPEPIIGSSASGFSVSFWVRLNGDVSRYRGIVIIYSTNPVIPYNYAIIYDGYYNMFVITYVNVEGSTNNIALSDMSKTFQLDTWYFFCITANSTGKVETYINGDLYTNNDIYIPFNDLWRNPPRIRFGQLANYSAVFYPNRTYLYYNSDYVFFQGDGVGMNGYIDDLRILNRGLYNEEIQRLYKGEVILYDSNINHNVITTKNNDNIFVGVGHDDPRRILHVHNKFTNNDTVIQLTTINNINFNSNTGLLLGKDVNNNSYLINNENANLSLGTNGSNRIIIDSAGNIGVGTTTTNSSKILDVLGNVKIKGDLQIDGSISGVSLGGSSQWSNSAIDTSNIYYNKGNIGIGTVNPISALHIHSNLANSNLYIQFTDNNTGITSESGVIMGMDTNDNAVIMNKGAKSILFGTSNNYRITINKDGKVGIGTVPSAIYTLAVSGDVEATTFRGIATSAGSCTGNAAGLSVTSGDLFITNSSTTSGDDIIIRTGGNTSTNDRITINKDGKVGIGIAPSATYTLAVSGDVEATTFRGTATTAGSCTGNAAGLSVTSGDLFITNSSTTSGDDIIIRTGGNTSTNDRITINKDGKVGIGIAPSATYTLAVSGDVEATTFRGTATTAGSCTGNAAGLSVTSGDLFITNSSTTSGDDIIIRTGGNTSTNDRITINKDGKVGIGIAPSATYTLAVSGDVEATTFRGNATGLTGTPGISVGSVTCTSVSSSCNITADGTGNRMGVSGTSTATTSLTVNGAISATGDITAFASDSRLKNIHSNINNPLEIVNSLNGFYYKFNDTANSYGFDKNKMEIGLNAQEVQKVLPELVKLAPFDHSYDNHGNLISKSGSNYLTLSYDKLVPVLIEGMKQLNNKNKKLEYELSNIKYKLNI